jgi:8-oxo-dGTP pyrophosphatase MutT (NUDIX family)
MPQKAWQLIQRETISDHRIFRLHHDRYRIAPSGLERDFVVIDAPDWINIVPITGDGRIVMIRQFRHGVRDVTLEVPGGMIDPGEDPAAAARRELREETGYQATAIEPLGWAWPNPAVQTNRLHCFVAKDVSRVGAPHPDEFERIEVELVPIAQIPALAREGRIGHALVLVALGLLGLLTERG